MKTSLEALTKSFANANVNGNNAHFHYLTTLMLPLTTVTKITLPANAPAKVHRSFSLSEICTVGGNAPAQDFLKLTLSRALTAHHHFPNTLIARPLKNSERNRV